MSLYEMVGTGDQNPLHLMDIDSSDAEDDSNLNITERIEERQVPNIVSKEFIGLYAQYAAIGLLYGSSGTYLPFCVYNYHGATNLCANSVVIGEIGWKLKLLIAILTDCYQPFGMRRKPWMLFG
jgi:hypothetical protein